MKKLIVIVMVLGAMQITAQEQIRDCLRGDKYERAQRFEDFTPEEIAKLKTKKMTLRLDLTEAQQSEIEKLHLANAKERSAMRDAHKLKREKSNGEKPSKEERLKMMNDRLDKQILMRKEMQRILSKEQFEKFEKNQNHKQKTCKHKNNGEKRNRP